MLSVLDPELTAASQAVAGEGDHPAVASAVRVESRGTVRAHHAEVLESMVVADPIHVVEDQPHGTAAPDLPLPADFADGLLQPAGE